MRKVVIVGGGISGLVTGIQLARAGISTTLIEKRAYPHHRVCGEYISNEAAPFLKNLGLFPEPFSPPEISRVQLTSTNGKSEYLPLTSGGFGISRYAFDHFLYEAAKVAGVNFLLNTPVEKVLFANEVFTVETTNQKFKVDLVVGSFGKRSTLDASLGRAFIKKRSPYLAVKYHVRTDHPRDLIGLHNFNGGYCGISMVEEGKINLCYLSHRDNLKASGNIRAMEEAVLFKNPFLKTIFSAADFILETPETINEISFETKGPVDHHILMTGDAAGMITPLCGNGMAIAIHSSKILAQVVARFCSDPGYSRTQLEQDYSSAWNATFKWRLWSGRQIQHLFGTDSASDWAVWLARNSKKMSQWLISKTHGKPF